MSTDSAQADPSMTVEQMAREVYDAWDGGPCGPTIEDHTYQMFAWLPDTEFDAVCETASEIVDDECDWFAFGIERPTMGPHARPTN